MAVPRLSLETVTLCEKSYQITEELYSESYLLLAKFSQLAQIQYVPILKAPVTKSSAFTQSQLA